MTASKYALELMTDWKHDAFAVETTNCEMCVNLRRTANYYSAYMVGPAFATTIVTIVALLVQDSWRQCCLLVASVALQILSYMLAIIRLPNAAVGRPVLCTCAHVPD